MRLTLEGLILKNNYFERETRMLKKIGSINRMKFCIETTNFLAYLGVKLNKLVQVKTYNANIG